jgi:hypothetical protein
MSCKILPLKKSKSYNFSIVILFWSNVLSWRWPRLWSKYVAVWF